MMKFSLCDYSNAYIFVKGNIAIAVARADAAAQTADIRHKQVMFKNCAPLTRCISERNNFQVDNVRDLDVAMPMCNLKEYSINIRNIRKFMAISKRCS